MILPLGLPELDIIYIKIAQPGICPMLAAHHDRLYRQICRRVHFESRAAGESHPVHVESHAGGAGEEV